MRVCLDTNVLVSAVATRGICADVLRIALADHEVVISEQVLTELRRALTEKLRVTEGLVEEIDELLRREADVVVDDAPKLEVTIRDEDDVGIVEQAVAGAADVLVTGDQDLIEMGEDRPIRVLTPRGFWDLLRSELAEPE